MTPGGPMAAEGQDVTEPALAPLSAEPPPPERWVRANALGFARALIGWYMAPPLAYALVAALPDAEPPGQLVAVVQAAREYADFTHGNLTGDAYRNRQESRDRLLDALEALEATP